MNISISFKWFDLWVGFFVDLEKQRVYFCPLPCIVILLQWNIQYSYRIKKGKGLEYKIPNLNWLVKIFRRIKK